MPYPGSPIMGFNYTNPNVTPPKQDGGNWAWNAAKGIWDFVKGNAGDVLQTGAGLIEGYMSSADRQKQLDELRRQYDESLKQRQAEAAASAGQFDKTLAETQAARAQSGSQFERTTGDAEAQAAVRAQTQLNTAPIADKAQALALARLGVSPGAFKPRDYTQGPSAIAKPFTAPGQNVATALQGAATSYRPGSGGVDTSAIKALLAHMGHGGTSVPAPQGPIAFDGTPPHFTPTPTRPLPVTPLNHPALRTPPAVAPVVEGGGSTGIESPADGDGDEDQSSPINSSRYLMRRMGVA